MITLSPGRILMKFILIFPDTCVRTKWFGFFRRATLNIALGNDSLTIASTRIASSFAIFPQNGKAYYRDRPRRSQRETGTTRNPRRSDEGQDLVAGFRHGR